MSFFHDIYWIFQSSMIFPGFPGVLSFFKVFQVEWEPCNDQHRRLKDHRLNSKCRLRLSVTQVLWMNSSDILYHCYTFTQINPTLSLCTQDSAHGTKGKWLVHSTHLSITLVPSLVRLAQIEPHPIRMLVVYLLDQVQSPLTQCLSDRVKEHEYQVSKVSCNDIWNYNC